MRARSAMALGFALGAAGCVPTYTFSQVVDGGNDAAMVTEDAPVMPDESLATDGASSETDAFVPPSDAMMPPLPDGMTLPLDAMASTGTIQGTVSYGGSPADAALLIRTGAGTCATHPMTMAAMGVVIDPPSFPQAYTVRNVSPGPVCLFVVLDYGRNNLMSMPGPEDKAAMPVDLTVQAGMTYNVPVMLPP